MKNLTELEAREINGGIVNPDHTTHDPLDIIVY